MTQRSLFETQTSVNQYGYPIEPESLVDATKMSRRTDPATSKEAAAQVACGLSAVQALFVATLKNAGKTLTAAEVAELAYPLSSADDAGYVLSKRETLRKRAREVVRLGWIIERPARRCTVTGNMATTFEVIR